MLPKSGDALAELLQPIDLSLDRLLELLVGTCTTNLACRFAVGPWTLPEARAVLAQVVAALGPAAEWRSNNSFMLTETWDADGQPDAYCSDPLTGYTFTFLAFADD